jgi:F-type H+-transporting ATPase subunit b
MSFVKSLSTAAFALLATPAFAKPTENFVNIKNPEFVVLIGFVLFIALLVYLKVPGLIGGMLDKRSAAIVTELEEARTLREDAQKLLADYERKQKEVAEHAEQIVAHAKIEADTAATQAKEDLKGSIARRLQAATDQIASAEAAAVKEVRDTAVTVAIEAAREVIASSMTAKDSSALIDAAIGDVGDKLH